MSDNDEDWVRGETGTEIQLSGVIHMGRVLQGSKSERDEPLLQDDSGQRYRLFLIGENPFSQGKLKSLVGQRVHVFGTWRNGVVRVAEDQLSVTEAEAAESEFSSEAPAKEAISEEGGTESEADGVES